MVYNEPRQANIGDFLGGAFLELGLIKREIGLYFAGFGFLGLLGYAAKSQTVGLGGLIGLAGFVAYWVAHYWLFQQLMKRHGIVEDDRFRVFQLFFMALLIGIAAGFATNFLVIPGVILMAKWIMAPAFLVARDRSLFQAMGDSWRASDGSTLQLSLAVFVILFGWLIAYGAVSGLAGALGRNSPLTVLTGLALHILPIVMMGLSVAVYRILTEPTSEVADVFA